MSTSPVSVGQSGGSVAGVSAAATAAQGAGAAVGTGPAVCPECEGAIRFDRVPLRGQVVRCGDCGVELEVTRTTPLALELAPEVREDWGE